MAEGHIGAIRGTRVLNSTASQFPSVAHVYGNIYVICWDEGGTDGYMCTVSIATSAPYAITIIELTHLEAAACVRPRIIKVAPNIFAYCYMYALDHGIVRTIPIGNDGYITGGNIDLLEFETVDCYEPEICEVTANMFVVAYRDTNDDGKIVTFAIDDAGQISNSIVDDWVFDSAYCSGPDIIKVGDGVFAIFFEDAVNDGWVKTLAISDGGTITESIIDFLNFETSTAFVCHAAHFTGNIYAVAYEDILGHGWVTTIQITAVGAIPDNYADRLNFNTGYGKRCVILGVTSNVLAIAYEDSATSGEIYTFWCLSDGDITEAPRDTLAFDSTLAGTPYIFHVAGNLYGVAYTGVSDYVTVKTFDIASAGNPKHLPLMGIG